MKKKATNTVLIILFSMMSVLWIYPIVWLILSSFKTTKEISLGSFFFPKEFTFENYQLVIEDGDVFLWFANSAVVTLVVIILTVIFSVMLAYALCRMRWRGREKGYMYTTLGIIIPGAVVMVPDFIIIKLLGLLDNPIGLILVMLGFNIGRSTLIAYGFLRGIPESMEEAAVIDGCNLPRLFVSVIMPLLKPAILTIIIYTFLNVWNEYSMALMLITNNKFMTIPIGMASFVTERGTMWGPMFAAMTLSSIVPLALFFSFNKKFEDVLVAGAVSK